MQVGGDFETRQFGICCGITIEPGHEHRRHTTARKLRLRPPRMTQANPKPAVDVELLLCHLPYGVVVVRAEKKKANCRTTVCSEMCQKLQNIAEIMILSTWYSLPCSSAIMHGTRYTCPSSCCTGICNLKGSSHSPRAEEFQLYGRFS